MMTVLGGLTFSLTGPADALEYNGECDTAWEGIGAATGVKDVATAFAAELLRVASVLIQTVLMSQPRASEYRDTNVR